MKFNRRGFSLIELLVVIAITSILSALAIVGYEGYIDRARVKTFEKNVETINKAALLEYTSLSNGLTSSIDEINTDGTPTGNKMSSATTCGQFIYSIRGKYKNFINPWGDSNTKMITIDTQTQDLHKKGMIQFVCHRGGSFLNGWNCPIEKSLFHIISYHQDGLPNDGSVRTDKNWLTGGTSTSNATGKLVSEWSNIGYVNVPAADREVPSMPYLTSAAGQSLCGSTGYTISPISVDADANY